MQKFLIIFAGTLFLSVAVFGQTEVWIRNGEGHSINPGLSNKGMDVDIDSEGYFYHLIEYRDTLFLGSEMFVSEGFSDALLVKTDTDGTHLWYKDFKNPNVLNANAVYITGNGNVLVGGFFENSLSIDDFYVSSQGFSPMYLAEFNPNGDLLDFAYADSSLYSNVFDIVSNENEEVFICGNYYGNINKDNVNLEDFSGTNGFTIKLDESLYFEWGFGSHGSGNMSIALDINEDGNIFVTGSYENNAQFGDTILQSLGINHDIYTLMLNPQGEMQWINAMVGQLENHGHDVKCINDNAVVLGEFRGGLEFSDTTLISYGGYDVFVGKINSQGDWLNIKSLGGLNNDVAYDIELVNNYGIYICGNYGGSMVLEDSVFSSPAINQPYILSLYNDLQFQSMYQMNALGTNLINNMSILGNVISVTGEMKGSISFAETNIEAYSNQDYFIAKIDVSDLNVITHSISCHREDDYLFDGNEVYLINDYLDISKTELNNSEMIMVYSINGSLSGVFYSNFSNLHFSGLSSGYYILKNQFGKYIRVYKLP